LPEGLEADQQGLFLRWIEKSADAVALYYNRFPVPAVRIEIAGAPGGRVSGGQTFPGDVPLIRMRVGIEATAESLLVKDWVMVHEMIHLAFPWMNRRHNWMAEGIAVYVESVARVQVGHVTEEQVWADFIKMMPKGLPGEDGPGLDGDIGWGQTYWGGAVFCLLADIAIRRETGNREGLQHALRAINAERDFRREWDFESTLAIGDRATGTSILGNLYGKVKDRPMAVNLDELWQRLGIRQENETVVLTSQAEDAPIRTAIMTALV
jgi:hypothetical protein